MRPVTKTRAAAPRIAVAIPAGGIGARFGSRIPKQFLTSQRVPGVTKTVGCFTRYPGVAAIAVAAPAAHVERTRRALATLARRVPLVVVPGGPTRPDSVWLAAPGAVAPAAGRARGGRARRPDAPGFGVARDAGGARRRRDRRRPRRRAPP